MALLAVELTTGRLLFAFSMARAAFSCSYTICSLHDFTSSRNVASSVSKNPTYLTKFSFLLVKSIFSACHSSLVLSIYSSFSALALCSLSSYSLSSSIFRITSTCYSKFFLCSSSTLSWYEIRSLYMQTWRSSMDSFSVRFASCSVAICFARAWIVSSSITGCGCY